MAIEVRDVSKRFGDFVALDSVSMTVESGGLVALLGPSGSGKSTLLRVIAGLERPDSGTVSIGGFRRWATRHDREQAETLSFRLPAARGQEA